MPVGQVFCPLGFAFGLWTVQARADQATKGPYPSPPRAFSRIPDRLVEPVLFGEGWDRGHAHEGGARNRRIAARMARTIGSVTATSASWKVMARA